MSKKDLDAWIAAFQQNQRQILEAHEAFQRSMLEGHTAFLKAMEASQQRLARAISGESTDISAEVVSLAPVPVPSEGRWTAEVVDAPRPGSIWSALKDHSTIGVVPDEFGVASHVVEELKKRGYDARLIALGEHTDVLVFLGALLVDQRRVARGEGVQTARAFLEQGFQAALLVLDMSGRFGLDNFVSFRAAHAGLLALNGEFETPIKVVDLDVGFRKPNEPAVDLVVEMLTGADQTPVGLPEDGRVVLTEVEMDAQRVPRNFRDDVALLVGGTPSHVATARRWWGGAIATIGQACGNADAHAVCDLHDAMAVYEAVDQVRLAVGPITFVCFVVDPTDNAPLTPIHTVFASTAADPITRMGAWVEPDAANLAGVSWAFLAEQQRRGDEASLRAVSSSDFEDGFQDVLFCETDVVFWALR